MSQCIYSDFCEGKCEMFDKEHHKGLNSKNSEYGWNEDGICVSEDDPNPFSSCTYYEPLDPNAFEEE